MSVDIGNSMRYEKHIDKHIRSVYRVSIAYPYMDLLVWPSSLLTALFCKEQTPSVIAYLERCPSWLLGATKFMNNHGNFVIKVKGNVTTELVLNKSSLHNYHCNYVPSGLWQFVIGYKCSTWNIRACSIRRDSEHRLRLNLIDYTLLGIL